MKKRWCWYCKHRGHRFRLFKNNGHVHCEHPNPDIAFGVGQHKDGMPYSGWASLREAFSSCGEFEQIEEA